MKRGNTALKRGVAIAAAFTTAIAGAVLAAPAASAADADIVAANVAIRATPIADAAFIAADGALITKTTEHGVYANYAASTTGTLPLIGTGAGQNVSGFQITVPFTADNDGAFKNTNTIAVDLAGATFTSTPSVEISPKPIELTDLKSVAGFKGAKVLGSDSATEAAAADTATAADGASAVVALPAGTVTRAVSPDGKKLTITFNGNDKNAGGADAGAEGYLVSVSGVRVTPDVDGNATAVTASVTGNADAVTTLAYVSPFSLSADGAGYPSNTKGAVALPDVTLAESLKAGFTADPSTYTLTVSGDKADAIGAPAVALESYGDVVSSVSGKLTAGVSGAGTTGVTVKPAATDLSTPAKTDNFVFKGLKVGNLKTGADVTVSLTSTAAALAVKNGNEAAAIGAQFSQSPAAGALASVKIAATTKAPRTAGDNRYETAAQIAASFSKVNAVVLANGLTAKDGADALGASFLAGTKDAPILLTDSSDTLPDATQSALVKVLKDSTGAGSPATVTIYVAGKTDSVSEAAANRAKFIAEAAVASGVKVAVVRLDGANRYETAAKAIAAAGSLGFTSYNLGKGSLNTAFLASGTVNADALAASGISAGAGIPVLLTNGTALDESIAKTISDFGIKQIIVLGGTDRVSADLVTKLGTDNGVTNVVRVAESNRYETSAALNTFAFKASADGGLGLVIPANATAYLANGNDGFVDALAVGPLVGKDSVSPALIVGNDLSAGAAKFLKDNKPSIAAILAIGGADRVSDETVEAAQKAIL